MRLLVTGGSGFIGTKIVEVCAQRGIEVANLDWHSPRDALYIPRWRDANLLDVDRTIEVVREFRPTHVLHLAARTDLDGANLEEYAANHIGTGNLINALAVTRGVERVVFTSTSLITKPGDTPRTDTEWRPHTCYGESKAAMERTIRNRTPVTYDWAIARPASIWGPGMGSEYRKFFRLVERGYYFHIGRTSPSRTMGYVDTAVRQLFALLTVPRDRVHERVFYIGDGSPMNFRDWAEEIRHQLGARAIPTIPYSAARVAALLGDAAAIARIPLPLHSFRLRNLVTEWVLPTLTTEAITGPSTYTLSGSVAKTIAWMRDNGHLKPR